MKIKQKGNTLMITLVIIMILIFHLLSFLQYEIAYARHIESLKRVDHVRILTNSTIAYIKYINKNEILLSENYQKNDITIHYTVDDMGDYFYVAVTIQDIDHMIQFVFDLDKQKNTINNFAYQ